MRRQLWASARKHRRQLTLALVGWCAAAAVAVAITWSLRLPALAGFVAGVMVGLLPFFGLTWVIAVGLAHRGMGADAERWTAEELSKLDERAWTVLHDVPLPRGNVDHVAIGPGRVYAIETKWISSRRPHVGWCARQAERQARELAALMAARGTTREVIPLLVVWGPGFAEAWGAAPRLQGRTRVVAGAHSEVWLQRMTAAADRLFTDWPAKRAVLGIIEECEPEATASGSEQAGRPRTEVASSS